MNKRVLPLLSASFLGCLGLVAGCGGGGSGGPVAGGGTNAGGGGTIGSSPVGNGATLAATFKVDVPSGNVTVVSTGGTLGGSARVKPGMFTGNAIGFKSTTLTNLSSLETGAKVMSVSLTNNSGGTIGVDSTGAVSGLNVLFGAFANTTGVVSQEANTVVSTFAGSTSGFADGATSVAKLNGPSGVAVGADGSVYVADISNNRIRKISGGYVSTLAGNGTAAEADGPATKAEFNGPYALAVNPVDGALIVADYTGNKIRRVTSTGVVTTVAGTGALGGVNGAGNVAVFSHPTAVAVDASGHIFVTEAASNRIRKIVLSGAATSSANYTVSTFAGNGTAGLLDGVGTAAEFNIPYGLATDPSGNLYVADEHSNAIRMIDPSANVTTIAGTSVESDLDGYGNAATFNHPFGLAYANGALFVSENGGQMIREVMPVLGAGVTASGWLVETLAGRAGIAGTTDGAGSSATFDNPRHIAVSPSSSLYLADFSDNRIRRINPSTGTLPIGTPTGSTNTTDTVQLSNADGVVDDSDLGAAPYITYSGSLGSGQTTIAQPWNFVVPPGVTSFQFQVIVEANTSELITLQAAVGAGSPLVDVRDFVGAASNYGILGGSAASARVGGFAALARDGQGNIYAAFPNNYCVCRIDTAGNVSVIAGLPGNPGVTDGAGPSARLDNPSGIAVDAAGDEIFIAEGFGNTVRRIAFLGGDPTNSGDWYVTTIAGSATAGNANGAGSTASFDLPYGIALSSGVLYVAEYAGNRIRSLSFAGGDRSQAANWYAAAVAGDNSATTGVSGHANGSGTAATFFAPTDIVADRYGNLYVSEFANNDVRLVDPTGKSVSTFVGSTTRGYVDGMGTAAQFSSPCGVAFDSAGYLYIADYGNDRVRRVSPAGNVETVAGNGTLGHVNGLGTQAEFDEPFKLLVTPSGALFLGSQDSVLRELQTVVSSAAGSDRKR